MYKLYAIVNDSKYVFIREFTTSEEAIAWGDKWDARVNWVVMGPLDFWYASV